jgi:hypothetical protein
MAFNITPQVGVDVNNPVLGTILAANGQLGGPTQNLPEWPYRPGQQVIGSDGRLYVFATVAVGQNITSALATCTITLTTTGTGSAQTTTAVATATGGSAVAPTFTSPASLGTTGNTYPDAAWFYIPGKLAA